MAPFRPIRQLWPTLKRNFSVANSFQKWWKNRASISQHSARWHNTKKCRNWNEKNVVCTGLESLTKSGRLPIGSAPPQFCQPTISTGKLKFYDRQTTKQQSSQSPISCSCKKIAKNISGLSILSTQRCQIVAITSAESMWSPVTQHTRAADEVKRNEFFYFP